MKTDRVFVLLLVILLPMTGCIDVADNAGAEDSTESSNDGMTVVNHYYNNTTTIVEHNNTTTIVEQQEPDLVHEYLSWDEVANWSLTVGEDQALEWVSWYGIYVLNYSTGPENIPMGGVTYNVTCDSNGSILEIGYAGSATNGFAWKGPGECTYVFGERTYSNIVDLNVHVMYRIHDVVNG